MKTITEQNALIAEFMGKGNTTSVNTFKASHNAEDLKYHSSWNWLMPVVEKIEEMTINGFPYRFTITVNNVFFENVMNLENAYIIQVSRTDSLRSDIFKAVVEFIEWYNQQSK